MHHEPKHEYPSTYYAQGSQSEQELVRLTIQGQMMTEAMGGSLAEQDDPQSLLRVLDIACGPGEWVMATAKTYPTMSLTGIDISRSMIRYAREQALLQHLEDRVSFRVMDAEAGHTCPASPALTQFSDLFQNALFQAGHLFEPAPSGLTAHLAPLLEQYGCKAVLTRTYTINYQAGTPSAQMYFEDMQRAYQTLRPFIMKWGPRISPEDYDALCLQALAEIQQSNFEATWNLLTAWGTN